MRRFIDFFRHWYFCSVNYIISFSCSLSSVSFSTTVFVGHVHDELIIETPMDTDLGAICEQMGKTPDWIEGLLLRADRYETQFYKKD